MGTVQAFWVNLINNDTQLLFAAVFDDDFKPYLADAAEYESEWVDALLTGTVEGFNPSTFQWLVDHYLTAEFFYAANPDVSVRDIKKMKGGIQSS